MILKNGIKKEVTNERPKNSEGYSDPTAYQAMMNLEIEELRFKKLLRSIKDV